MSETCGVLCLTVTSLDLALSFVNRPVGLSDLSYAWGKFRQAYC